MQSTTFLSLYIYIYSVNKTDILEELLCQVVQFWGEEKSIFLFPQKDFPMSVHLNQR